MVTKTNSGKAGGLIIVGLLFLAMLLKCTGPETQAQMQKDISGLTQAQKNQIVGWQQQQIYPGGLSK